MDLKDGKPIKGTFACSWKKSFEQGLYILAERNLVKAF